MRKNPLFGADVVIFGDVRAHFSDSEMLNVCTFCIFRAG